jgi:hypothetical protein
VRSATGQGTPSEEAPHRRGEEGSSTNAQENVWSQEEGKEVRGKEGATRTVVIEGATHTVVIEGATRTVVTESATRSVVTEGATRSVVTEGATRSVVTKGATHTVVIGGATRSVVTEKGRDHVWMADDHRGVERSLTLSVQGKTKAPMTTTTMTYSLLTLTTTSPSMVFLKALSTIIIISGLF